MKKYIIFTILLLCSFTLKVQAYDDSCSQLNDQGMPTCITICGYDLQKEDTKFSITYRPEENALYYSAIYYNGGIFNDGAIRSWTDNITSNERLIIDEELRNEILNNGYCPNYVYVDNNFDHEFCIDDDGEWCLANAANDGFTTSFNDEKGHGTLSYEFVDKMEQFFDDFEITESDLLSENYDLEAEIINSFQDTLLYGLNMPDFMLNMNVYGEGFETVKQELNATADRLKTDALNRLESGSMTQEEYDNFIATVDNALGEKTQATENAKELLSSSVNTSLNYSGDENKCSTYFGSGAEGTPMYYINFVFNLIKYLAIIMLFVFTIVEYAKAIAASDDKAIKKATSNTVKRIIIAVIIFFAPTLLTFLFRILGLASDPSCGL